MMRHRSSSWLVSAESQRPTPFSLAALFGGPSLAFVRHRRQPAVLGVHDQRRPQVVRERRLTAIQSELREVVVHVGDSSGRRLLGLPRRRGLFGGGGLLRRVELLCDVLRPLERHVGGVRPQALQVGLTIRCPRRYVCLGGRRPRPGACVRRLSREMDRAKPCAGHRADSGDPRERSSMVHWAVSSVRCPFTQFVRLQRGSSVRIDVTLIRSPPPSLIRSPFASIVFPLYRSGAG